MRKIIVLSMLTLDGVMQAPGGPKEDSSGGFAFGGWVAPFFDTQYGSVVEKELQPADYLLGRKTFEIWADYWPKHSEGWPGIMSGRKYVLSGKLSNTDRLIADWPHSEVVSDVEAIRRIKASEGADLQVWGSSQLVQLLLEHDLVDELRLKIHPVLLGQGKKLFDGRLMPASFSLIESSVTSTGVVMAFYKRAGMVETGTAGARMEYAVN
jgi:dihydrofolate reductase